MADVVRARAGKWQGKPYKRDEGDNLGAQAHAAIISYKNAPTKPAASGSPRYFVVLTNSGCILGLSLSICANGLNPQLSWSPQLVTVWT